MTDSFIDIALDHVGRLGGQLEEAIQLLERCNRGEDSPGLEFDIEEFLRKMNRC